MVGSLLLDPEFRTLVGKRPGGPLTEDPCVFIGDSFQANACDADPTVISETKVKAFARRGQSPW